MKVFTIIMSFLINKYRKITYRYIQNTFLYVLSTFVLSKHIQENLILIIYLLQDYIVQICEI